MAKRHGAPYTHLKYKPIHKPVPETPPRPKPKLGPLLIGGGILYVAATYVTMVVFRSREAVKHDHDDQPITPSSFDTSEVWERNAKGYDKEVGWDEVIMGIGLMRRWLVGHAKGDVLEVSVGTGRNFDYYKADQIDTATFTDRHEPMLNEARSKFEQYKEKFHKTFVQFKTANVDQPQTMDKGKYDTVIDTFGLCSCANPAEALVSLADACKSEDSRILLLEHGRSHYGWLNRLLDTNLDNHVKRYGCWWNRDVMGLFEEEKVKEKLEIETVSRWHFGTTCYIVAKPKKNAH